jgi:hypothetical protein
MRKSVGRIIQAIVLTIAVALSTAVATPAHAATDLLIGSTWKPELISTKQPHYPGVEISRIFFQAGQTFSWNDSRIQYLKTHGIIPFVSIKDYSVSKMQTIVNTLPADIPKAYVTYCHECDTSQTASTFKSQQQAMWNGVKNLTNHVNGRVKYMSIQTRQFTENNGRSYSTYWCGCGDYFAVDMYVNSWENAYPAPSTFFSKTLAFGQSIGYGVFYPELGAIRMPFDSTGSARAAWINGSVAVMHQYPRLLGAIWWDALGTGGRVFDLDNGTTNYNTPEATAWRNALATN